MELVIGLEPLGAARDIVRKFRKQGGEVDVGFYADIVYGSAAACVLAGTLFAGG